MDALTSADFAAFAASAAAAGQAMSPALVRIDGVTYTATVPTPRHTTELIPGAEITDGTLIARILISDLPTAPAENQKLEWKRPTESSWNSIVWFIRTVTRSPLDVEWHLSCTPHN